MFVCPSVCRSVRQSVCLSVSLSDYFSVCLSVCLSVFLSVCLSVCLLVYPSACLSICLNVNISAVIKRRHQILNEVSCIPYAAQLNFECHAHRLMQTNNCFNSIYILTDYNIYLNSQMPSDRPINNTSPIRLSYEHSNLLRIRSVQQSRHFHSHFLSEIFWIALIEIQNLKILQIVAINMEKCAEGGVAFNVSLMFSSCDFCSSWNLISATSSILSLSSADATCDVCTYFWHRCEGE